MSTRLVSHTHEQPDLLVMVHSALAALPRSMRTSSSQESVSSMLLGLRRGTAEKIGNREGEGKRQKGERRGRLFAIAFCHLSLYYWVVWSWRGDELTPSEHLGMTYTLMSLCARLQQCMASSPSHADTSRRRILCSGRGWPLCCAWSIRSCRVPFCMSKLVWLHKLTVWSPCTVVTLSWSWGTSVGLQL